MRNFSQEFIGKVIPGWIEPPSGYATLCVFQWKLYWAGLGHCGLHIPAQRNESIFPIYVTGRAHAPKLYKKYQMSGDIIEGNLDAHQDWKVENRGPNRGRLRGVAQVFIPLRGNSDGTQVGLDAAKIIEFWRIQCRLMDRRDPVTGDMDRRRFDGLMYKAASPDMNCNAYCRRALEAGGAGLFKKKPAGRVFQGAREVANWAAEVALRIKMINEKLATLNRMLSVDRLILRSETGTYKDTLTNKEKTVPKYNPGDVPTAKEWYQFSYVGPFAKRKEQVAIIDRCLVEYDKVRHKRGDNFEHKLDLLITMLGAALDHLQKKPKSDRRTAVQIFSWQVRAEIIRLTDNPEPVIAPEPDYARLEGLGRARSARSMVRLD